MHESIFLYKQLPNKINNQITRKLSGKPLSLIEAIMVCTSSVQVFRAGDLASPNLNTGKKITWTRTRWTQSSHTASRPRTWYGYSCLQELHAAFQEWKLSHPNSDLTDY